MKNRVLWFTASLLMVLALLLASCGKGSPTTSPTTAATTTPTTITPTSTTVSTPPTTKPTITPTTTQTTAANLIKDPSTGEMVEKPRYGGTITGIFYANVTAWDTYRNDPANQWILDYYLEKPLIANWAVDRKICDFRSNNFPESILKGNIVESWEWTDTTTCVWHVRKGVQWHNKPPANGRELVASDIVFTYNRQCGFGDGYTTPSPYYFGPELQNMKSIEATDKYTIVVKLKAPFAQAAIYWAGEGYLPIVCPDVIKAYGNFPDWKVGAIGTGPWVVEDYVNGGTISFAKNPNYWGTDEKYPGNKIPYADKLQLPIIEDVTTRLAAIRTGKIDVVTHQPLTGIQRDSLAKTNPELKFFETYTESKSLTIVVNNKPFNDIRVRKALQMAIDLKGIVKGYFNNHAYWFPSLAGPGMGETYWTPPEKYPQETLEGFTYDPKKAKALLAEAGYPNGFKTNIVTRGAAYIDLLEVAQSYLAAIGVTLEIKQMEYTAGNAFFYAHSQDQMVWYRASGNWNPVEIIRYWYSGCSWNFGMVKDPKYDKMFEDILAELDPAKRDALVNQANFYGTQQFWGVYMPPESVFFASQPWIKGYNGEQSQGSFMPTFFARIWVDQTMKKAAGH